MKRAAEKRIKDVKKYYQNNPTMNKYMDLMSEKYGSYYFGTPMVDDELPPSNIPFTTPGVTFYDSNTSIVLDSNLQQNQDYTIFVPLSIPYNDSAKVRIRVTEAILSENPYMLIIARSTDFPSDSTFSAQNGDLITGFNFSSKVGVFYIGTDLDRIGKNFFVPGTSGFTSGVVDTDIDYTITEGMVFGFDINSGTVTIEEENGNNKLFKPSDEWIAETYVNFHIALKANNKLRLTLEYEP